MSAQLQCFISFLDTPFSDEQKAGFHALNAYDASMIQRVAVLDGRVLVRGISTSEIIDSTMAFLTAAGKDPHLLFAHHEDGMLYLDENIGMPNFTEYLSFFPPYTTEDMNGNTVMVQSPQNTGAGWELPERS